MADHELMTIGEFSRLVGVTPSALRYYDACGLLVPAHTSTATGYRRYAQDQRDRARVIRMLREAGLPLADVRRVVDGPSDEAPQVVRRHLARNAEQTRTAAAALRQALVTLTGSDEPDVQVHVSGPELASGIRQVRHAVDGAAVDAATGVDLACVQVEIDTEEVRLVATDRYRLALRALRALRVEWGCACVAVSADALGALVPALLLADTVMLRWTARG